jgi:hypothetical protein
VADEKSEFEKQTEETAAMTRRRKTRLARLMQMDEDVPASELLGISKLEREVANAEALVRLQELTRERKAL